MKIFFKQITSRDWRGKIVWRLWLLTEQLAIGYYSLWGYLRAAYWGVEIGKGCKFYGHMLFRRVPSSRIIIGDYCIFRSAEWANQMGINHPCVVSALRESALVKIGSGSGFSGTCIAATERIEIGEKVMCGANTLIADADAHPLDPNLRHVVNIDAHAPVIIDDNVWLGLNVVVLKGVKIGKNSVIGANSIVVSDIAANVIVAGNPAKVIRTL